VAAPDTDVFGQYVSHTSDATGLSVTLARIGGLADLTTEAVAWDLGVAATICPGFVDSGAWAIVTEVAVVTSATLDDWWGGIVMADGVLAGVNNAEGYVYRRNIGLERFSPINGVTPIGATTGASPYYGILVPGPPTGDLGMVVIQSGDGQMTTGQMVAGRAGGDLHLWAVFGIRSVAGAPNATGKLTLRAFARQWRP